jgi:hypothetical protein
VTTALADNPDGATFPYCDVTSLGSYCGSCATNINTTCGTTELLHVCTKTSDCASDTANPQCCAVFNYHICVSGAEATFGNLTCLP